MQFQLSFIYFDGGLLRSNISNQKKYVIFRKISVSRILSVYE